jgi:endoglucanase
VPALVVGVAVRYIHTHAAILHRDDFDQAAHLMTAVVKRLDTATVTQLRS